MTVCAVWGSLGHFWENRVEVGASKRMVRWLRFGLPLWFNRKVVKDGGLPKLTFFFFSSLGSELSRSSQTRRSRLYDFAVYSKTVHSRNVGNRVRSFLPGFPGCEENPGLVTGDRSMKTERVIDSSDVSNLHSSKSKIGRGRRLVCHVPRFIRCIPPHPSAGRLTRVPLFQSQRQTLHVSGTPVWPLMTVPWSFTQVLEHI